MTSFIRFFLRLDEKKILSLIHFLSKSQNVYLNGNHLQFIVTVSHLVAESFDEGLEFFKRARKMASKEAEYNNLYLRRKR